MLKPLLALILTAILMPALSARADVTGVVAGTDAYAVANDASAISKVVSFKIGTRDYKVVSLDSKLNGDVTMTTILFVGEDNMGVGGAAGYEAAFILSPTQAVGSFKSVIVRKGQIVISMYTLEGKVVQTKYSYDSSNKILVEKK